MAKIARFTMEVDQKTCSRNAFTLVELLVAFGVIVLLMAISLPVLGSSKSRANEVACIVSLRQINILTFVYASENGDVGPETGLYHSLRGDGTPPDSQGLGWAEMVAGGDLSLFEFPLCPDIHAEADSFPYFLHARWARMNDLRAVPLHLVVYPSDTMVVSECTIYSSYRAPFGRSLHMDDDIDKDDGISNSIQFVADATGFVVHGKRNNTSLYDGSARPVDSLKGLTHSPRVWGVSDWAAVGP